MSEPWKIITCPAEQCQHDLLDENGKVKEGYHIAPDVDTDYMTQFTCPRCGLVETWGPTRRMIALSLYERYHRV